MTNAKVIPVLRIFDYDKAIAFYAGWLGFAVQWEHTFAPGMPKYLEIRRDDIVFHLSEHSGDGTPGSRVFIWCEGLKAFHEELTGKNYKYNRPGFDETFYGSWCVQVIDPFHNQISFNEKRHAAG